MPNPGNIRQAMNGMDPRQRGLFAAAWTIGFAARFAKGAASTLTLGSGCGQLGFAYAKADYPQPWFDEKGGIYPVYHVVKGLTDLRGQPLVDLEISTPDEIQAIATKQNGGIELWVANLTDQTKSVELTPKLTGTVSILSAMEFERATKDLNAMDSLECEFAGESAVLPPYAVARLRLATG